LGLKAVPTAKGKKEYGGKKCFGKGFWFFGDQGRRDRGSLSTSVGGESPLSH